MTEAERRLLRSWKTMAKGALTFTEYRERELPARIEAIRAAMEADFRANDRAGVLIALTGVFYLNVVIEAMLVSPP